MRRVTDVRVDDDEAARLAALRRRNPLVDDLANAFRAAGHALHLVGGAVRDALLGDDGEVDLDFTTDARPERSEAVLRGWADAVWLTGAAFGTVSGQRADTDGVAHTVEVTTYRADTYTPGSRHPEVAYGERVEQDLSRRDFTVNALALDLTVPVERSGEALVDAFDGLADLRAEVLRTPVDPRQSFDDDPLRMLRLARFAARLGFAADPATLGAATDMADDLTTISAERVRMELVKLLAAGRATAGLDVLASTRLLSRAPGLAEMGDPVALAAVRPRLERWAARGGASPDGSQPAAALTTTAVQDGPIATSEVSAASAGRVPTHDGAVDDEVVGLSLLLLDLDDTGPRLRALTCSTDVVRGVSAVVAALRDVDVRTSPTPARVRRDVADLGTLLPALLAALACLEDERPGAVVWATEHRATAHDLTVAGDLPDLSLPVDGGDVMRELGLSPGPRVGTVLATLREARLDGGPLDRVTALRLARTVVDDDPDGTT